MLCDFWRKFWWPIHEWQMLAQVTMSPHILRDYRPTFGHQIPTFMAHVQSQVRSCVTCCAQIATRADHVSVLRLPLPVLVPPAAAHSSIGRSVWGWTMGWMTWVWLIPGRDNTSLFSTASRLALGLTQLSIQWVLGAISLGVKWLGHEAN